MTAPVTLDPQSRRPIRVERAGRILVVTIDRPHVRNAIDRTTAALLHDVFVEFDRDDDLDVAILTGSDGVFCSGADLHAVAAGNGNKVVADVAEPGPEGVTRLQLDKPVIAAIEGYAVAGGLELALWCDLRVAAESAVLGVFCRRWGVPLVDGGTVRLPRLIGHSRAMDMILTGRGVRADEALTFGLVNRIAPDGEALGSALELAASLASFPQVCMRNDRKSATSQWGKHENQALLDETVLGLRTIRSGETEAGAARFHAGSGRAGSFDLGPTAT